MDGQRHAAIHTGKSQEQSSDKGGSEASWIQCWEIPSSARRCYCTIREEGF